jgi:hypothetical protein
VLHIDPKKIEPGVSEDLADHAVLQGDTSSNDQFRPAQLVLDLFVAVHALSLGVVYAGVASGRTLLAQLRRAVVELRTPSDVFGKQSLNKESGFVKLNLPSLPPQRPVKVL